MSNKFLITGGAGFIGSNLVKTLLEKEEEVHVLDNFSSGNSKNLEQYLDRITLYEGTVCNPSLLNTICQNIDYIIHLAAVSSVKESIENPQLCHDVNVSGTFNILEAARLNGVKKLIFASTAALYGESDQETPKEECMSYGADLLSPYAVSKMMGESYCKLYNKIYGLHTSVLRYFNVYGERQNPDSGYAAVIPKFISALLNNTPVTIFGDGSQTRDFVYVQDVVYANLQAIQNVNANGQAFNIASGKSITILELHNILSQILNKSLPSVFEQMRKGDIIHSKAATKLSEESLGFKANFHIQDGLQRTVDYFLTHYLLHKK